MGHPSVRVAHSVEGRIRLKVRHSKGKPEVLNAFAETFRRLPGIERVETNPVTGTVLLFYDPDRHREFVGQFDRVVVQPPQPPKTDIDKFADVVAEEAEFLAQHSQSARVFIDAVKGLDREIKVRSNNNVDLKIVLAGGVIAAMFLEIGATAATPVWVTLLLFGANHFVELHSKGAKPNGAEARAGSTAAPRGERAPKTAEAAGAKRGTAPGVVASGL